MAEFVQSRAFVCEVDVPDNASEDEMVAAITHPRGQRDWDEEDMGSSAAVVVQHGEHLGDAMERAANALGSVVDAVP